MIGNVQNSPVNYLYGNYAAPTTAVFLDPDIGEVNIGNFCWNLWNPSSSVPYGFAYWRDTSGNTIKILTNMANVVFDGDGNVTSADLTWT